MGLLMYKMILWGAGAVYNKHVNILKLYEKMDVLKVIGITADAIQNIKCLDGFKIYKTTEISNLDYDYLIIMNERNFAEIMNDAMGLGVPKEKIISYKVLEIPNLDFDKYFNVKAKNISIVSNNCWGGILYKSLGLECLSPFKNLFLEDEDYLRLLSDFKQYMKYSLIFDHYEIDRHSKEQYPVMRLKDIYIHFNHDSNIESAVEKWEKRKTKINYEELFVEMYTEDESVAKRFSQLEGFKNKLCFVPFETSIECCMRLQLEKNQKEFWEAVNSNAGRGIVYDALELLNGKKIYRME